MNKFQKVGLAIVAASGMSFAADGPWWTAAAPHGQVAFPWVTDCKDDETKFDESEPDNECFKTLGGWWFAYIAGPAAAGENPNNCRVSSAGEEPSKSSAENYVIANINNNWVSFVGPDNENCEGPDVTNRVNGDSYLPDGYLELKLSVGTGINGLSEWKPSIAGVGVNFSTPPEGPQSSLPVFITKNMNEYGGFCMKYESDHMASDDFMVTLGWDETGALTDDWKYDPWEAPIPVGNGIQTANFAWKSDPSTCTKEKKAECGDFILDGWSKDPHPIIDAITKMVVFKFRLKSYTPAEVNFKLYAFGPKGTCDGTITPVISDKIAQNSVKFTMEGKMLSINKSAMVQIYNLQGAIVQSQTLTPTSRMNLSNLPSGIYMVRAPSLGHTSRIVIK